MGHVMDLSTTLREKQVKLYKFIVALDSGQQCV